MQWTEEAINRVVDLAQAGRSMREIGNEFGVSKSAIIGLYRRERIKRGTLPPVTPRKRVLKSVNPVNIAPAVRRNPVTSWTSVGGGLAMPMPTLPATGIGVIMPVLTIKAPRTPAVGILDVTGCRWPTGEDDAVIGRQTFCNHAKRDGSSYCAEHAALHKASYSRTLINETIRGAIKAVYKKRAA